MNTWIDKNLIPNPPSVEGLTVIIVNSQGQIRHQSLYKYPIIFSLIVPQQSSLKLGFHLWFFFFNNRNFSVSILKKRSNFVIFGLHC